MREPIRLRGPVRLDHASTTNSFFAGVEVANMDRPTMYQFGTATSTGTAEDGTEVTDVSRRTRSRLALVLVAAAAGSVGATAMLRNSPVATSGAALASSEAAASAESNGALEFTNEYGGQPMSVQSGYYPWDRIVEPYRVSTASTDCVCTVQC